MGSVRLRVGQEVELCLDDAGLQAGDPTYMCNSCHRHGTDGKSTPSPGCASGTLCSWVLEQSAGASHISACSSHTSFSLHLTALWAFL